MNKVFSRIYLKKRFHKNLLTAVIFAAFIAVFYGATVFHGFVQDDVPLVEKNPYIKSLKYTPKAFTSCLWEYANKGCEGRVFYYRPAVFLSYIFVSQISNAPWVFHLAHLLYFFAVVFLIFLLADALTKNFAFSFASAIIFLIHPVNTQVVNWISTDPDILLLIFTLLALLFYVKYRKRRSPLNIGVYVFYFLALLSKESAVVMPLLILSADIFIFKTKIKALFKWPAVKGYAAFGLSLAAYLLMRSAVLGSGNYFGQFSLSERIYAAFALFTKYLGKVFYPYPLQAAYDFKITANFFTPVFLISAAAVFLFCAAFIFSVKRKKNLLAFSLIWAAIFIFPALIFLQAAGAGSGVFLERYLFASMVGFSFAMAYVPCYILKVQAILAKEQKKLIFLRPLTLFLAVIVAVVWVFSWQDNKVWRNNETLYAKILSQAPSIHGIRYQLGQLYYEKGELEKARSEYEEIIRRDPEWQDITMAYKGLGDYWRAKGNLDESLENYQKAVDSAVPSPRDYITFNDLGAAYMNKGNYLKGLSYFCQSLQLLPENQTTIDNFNVAISAVDSEYGQKGILYENIQQELRESSGKDIIFQRKECKDDCYAEFVLRSPNLEVLLPFLISAVALPDNENMEIINPSFDSQQGIISLGYDGKFGDKAVSFVFPTCGGAYYEASTN